MGVFALSALLACASYPARDLPLLRRDIPLPLLVVLPVDHPVLLLKFLRLLVQAGFEHIADGQQPDKLTVLLDG